MRAGTGCEAFTIRKVAGPVRLGNLPETICGGRGMLWTSLLRVSNPTALILAADIPTASSGGAFSQKIRYSLSKMLTVSPINFRIVSQIIVGCIHGGTKAGP